ncbi:MAG: methyl-accepting chemotaxis protein [bacterium]
MKRTSKRAVKSIFWLSSASVAFALLISIWRILTEGFSPGLVGIASFCSLSLALLLFRILGWDRYALSVMETLQGANSRSGLVDSSEVDLMVKRSELLVNTFRDLLPLVPKISWLVWLCKCLDSKIKEASFISGDVIHASELDEVEGQEKRETGGATEKVKLIPIYSPDGLPRTVWHRPGSLEIEIRELTRYLEEAQDGMLELNSFLDKQVKNGRAIQSRIETIAKSIFEGGRTIKDLTCEAESAIAMVKQAANSVQDLGRWSREVGKILEVIKDIADETNLLALNAGIIAAQAGEQGRGFVVIAEEIRSLAERTSSSTEEIDDLVRTVQASVASVTAHIGRSLETVEHGEKLARGVGDIWMETFRSFDQLSEFAKDMAASFYENKKEIEGLKRLIDRASKVSDRVCSNESAAWKSAEFAAQDYSGSLGESSGIKTWRSMESRSTCAIAATASKTLESSSSVGSSSGDSGRIKSGIAEVKEMAELIAKTVSDLRNDLIRICLNGKICLEGFDKRCWVLKECPESIRKDCPAFARGEVLCFALSSPDSRLAKAADACKKCPFFESVMETMEGESKR